MFTFVLGQFRMLLN